MKFTLKHTIAAILLLLSIAAPVAAGPLEDGNAAYKVGDYETAMRILRPLADQGDGKAETIVGLMYYFNYGVPLDWVSAYMWFSLAAAHGNSLWAFFLDQMTRKMTQREIAEAQKRVSEWRPANQPPAAAHPPAFPQAPAAAQPPAFPNQLTAYDAGTSPMSFASAPRWPYPPVHANNFIPIRWRVARA